MDFGLSLRTYFVVMLDLKLSGFSGNRAILVDMMDVWIYECIRYMNMSR